MQKYFAGRRCFVATVLVLSLLPALFSSGAAAAPGGDSPEARQACTSDAFRLCNNAMPDRGRVTACLRANRASLSPACRTVFGGGGGGHRGYRHVHHRRAA
jgi:hypothetical protein